MLSALRADNSPFSEEQLELLRRSLQSLDEAQAQWLSGYLAGRLAAQPPGSPAASAEAGPAITILYGSETGNGEGIAAQLADDMKKAGFHADTESLGRFRVSGLRRLKHAAFVISTHGEGDPPEDARDLFEYLEGDRAPDLGGLSYRILALGDRSYTHFCAAGRRLDERLRALGARRFGPRVECDADFSAGAAAWNKEVLGYAREHLPKAAAGAASPSLRLVPDAPRWTRENPYPATVERVQEITAEGSGHDIRHLELSLGDSGITYQPGDVLGVWAPNDPELVADILARLEIDPAERVRLNGEDLDVAAALAARREITRLDAGTVSRFARAAGLDGLRRHIESLDADEQREFLHARQLADLAVEHPVKMKAQDLLAALRPLTPRSYSIASSLAATHDEVHLTVATRRSNAIGVERAGVASHFLNHRVRAGGAVRVFVQPNRRFRLPEDPAAPLIMIAAGTGIAPYRAFMQQREQQDTGSPAWLVFGNRHLRTDFLYQREWLHWRSRGLLSRIDVAFSRDQAEKHYVQDVVAREAGEIADWLGRGAHVYICGSLAMGEAVQAALAKGIAARCGIEPGRALDELRRERRLHQDLY